MATELFEGLRVGNYVLIERLGKGAFADVWKATHHERPDRTVAVKIATVPGYQRQLAREGALPDIKHPNVVPILDADTKFTDLPYIVMPYRANGNLADTIARYTSGLPEDLAAQLIQDVLSGLAEAHRRGLVHRDIKPQNVLLDDDGHAQISDFGLSLTSAVPRDSARSMIQSASLSIDQGHNIAGTLGYMAPEVLGGQPASPSSDVFSVGILLFEITVGRRPYGSELPSHCREQLQRTAWWDGLYYWATKGPDERYTDAGAMLHSFQQGPKSPPLAAPTQTPATRSTEVGSTPMLKWPAAQPLPKDLWTALAQRWDEQAELLSTRRRHRHRIEEAAQVYAETHTRLKALRAEESRIEAACAVASQNLHEACERTLRALSEQVEAQRQRRQHLIAEGCLPKHPDVLSLEDRISSYSQLEESTRALPGGDADNPLAKLLMAWQNARRVDGAAAYRDFLAVHGDITRSGKCWTVKTRRSPRFCMATSRYMSNISRSE